MNQSAESITGVLVLFEQGDGELSDPHRSFRPGPKRIWVPRRLIRDFALPQGASVTGPIRQVRQGLELTGVTAICGLAPDVFARRRPFKELTPVDPTERFRLGDTSEMSMRVVDLVAPIAKGTRALIVAPPKAGKTMLLMSIARAIRATNANARIIVVLIDERPEEVTHFRRSVEAEVLASSKDQSPEEHIELAAITLDHVRTELECGRDVILLVDSLTRMGRAFNVMGSGTGRTMTGGLEAGVLDVPRRFFGLARHVEEGGSVTIVATALVETGSRMDELIFQEFKGTGNSEIVLDRTLAEARIFPAVDISRSGTRKEELLYSADERKRIALVRRALAGRKPASAMQALLKALEPHKNNKAFLKSIAID